MQSLQQRGFEVFLDLKFHDIPNTVAAACAAAADLGVWMVNVHCSGGARMIATARDRLERCAHRPLLIGVTVLTSLDAEDLAAVGCPGDPAERVLRLAELGRRAGLDGVVCSPAGGRGGSRRLRGWLCPGDTRGSTRRGCRRRSESG